LVDSTDLEYVSLAGAHVPTVAAAAGAAEAPNAPATMASAVAMTLAAPARDECLTETPL
jgi:hypothetical protein